ncbi:hypothetical protein JW979_15780 [bacterium]|nr:hypothetical protein [candidate division CSSED10-310 bacterium]
MKTLICITVVFLFIAPAFGYTFLDDDFDGNSGGVPSGWSINFGTGSVVEHDSVVTITDNASGNIMIIYDASSFNPQGEVSTIVTNVDVLSASGGNFPFFQTGIVGSDPFGEHDFIFARLKLDGTLSINSAQDGIHEEVELNVFPQPFTFSEITITLIVDDDSFQVITDNPIFDSGDLLYSTTFTVNNFTLASIKTDATVLLSVDAGDDMEIGSADFDWINVDTTGTPPTPDVPATHPVILLVAFSVSIAGYLRFRKN